MGRRLAPGLILLAIGAAPDPAAAQGASFDCRKARTLTEKLICGDPRLQRLDGYLGRVYGDTHNAQPTPGRNPLYYEQISWLKRRNRVCKVSADLSGNEIMALQRINCLARWTMARAIVLAGRYRQATGQDHPIAETLAEEIIRPGR